MAVKQRTGKIPLARKWVGNIPARLGNGKDRCVWPWSLERQLTRHGFVSVKGWSLHFLLHLLSPRIFSVEGGVGRNYPLRDMDVHVHRQQAGALKCQAVENKINCKAEHPHLCVFPWQTSLSHPQVLDLALCCRAWLGRADPQLLLRCELWRKSLGWKMACAACYSFQDSFSNSMRKIHPFLLE